MSCNVADLRPGGKFASAKFHYATGNNSFCTQLLLSLFLSYQPLSCSFFPLPAVLLLLLLLRLPGVFLVSVKHALSLFLLSFRSFLPSLSLSVSLCCSAYNAAHRIIIVVVVSRSNVVVSYRVYYGLIYMSSGMPFLTFDSIVTRTLLPNPYYLLIFNMMMTTTIHASQISHYTTTTTATSS